MKPTVHSLTVGKELAINNPAIVSWSWDPKNRNRIKIRIVPQRPLVERVDSSANSADTTNQTTAAE